MNFDELFRQRYGQGRFNPAAGQTQMTFQEWMDRHPALQGRGGDKNFANYQGFTGADNGAAYTGPGTPDLPDNADALMDASNRVGAAGGLSGMNMRNQGQVSSQIAQTPPDQPPGPGAAGPGKPSQGGLSYADFLKRRGVAGRKSSSTNAAAWRRTQGKKKEH